MKLLVNATSIASRNLTGIERFALRLSQELYRINNDIEIFSTIKIPGVPTARVPAMLTAGKKLLNNREYLFRAIWDQTCFRYLVAKSKPDVIFFPIQDGLLYPPVKQIVTVHDLHYLHFDTSIPECRHEIHRIRTRLYRAKMPSILAHSSAVVTVSAATKQELVEAFGLPPNKVHVIYNGYDDGRFKPIDASQIVLQRYGLRQGGYFLFLGSILRHKNLVRLVQAFAELKCELSLVMAGACKDAAYLDEVMDAASKSGIEDRRLVYLKYVPDDDLPSLYSGAVALALPSLHEGFGVPLIEAMACGTPVITSNCSAMVEVAGDAAVLVDPYDVESITSAMRAFVNDPEVGADMKKRGLKRAGMFQWATSAARLYALCTSIGASS